VAEVDAPHNPATDSTVLVKRLREVSHLTAEELDRLPFGVIQVDTAGKVLAYNATEARLAGREPSKVIGRHFFTEIAPCTNVPSFAARFHRGIERGQLRDVFPFTFPFPTGPVLVTVTLMYEPNADHAWIFVDRAGAADGP
jgi:photoactive yellow protein